MATVYLAEDVTNHRRVAIKVLRPEIAAALGAERFLREIEVTANLDHPHILALFDSGEARVPPLRNTERGTGGEAFLYYVMPYVEGESLRDRLNRDKQLPVDDAVEIAREVATALGYAHARGIVHRDIKPENILLSAGLARVADFGIAKAIDDAGGTALTQTGAIIGTAPYLSPEQAGGELELDGRSDLYALGCVLYEMFAGQPPFTGATVESIVRQHLTSTPRAVTELRSSVPPAVENALATCLAKTSADRYRTASDLVAALGSAESLKRTPPLGPTRGWRWRPVAAGIGIVAAALGGWWWLGSPGSGEVVAATSGPSWVVVAEFDGTVDEVTRQVARRQVSAVIDESGTFLTVHPSQLAVGLGLAMMPETTRVDVDAARELAERGGFGTVVAGTVDQLGEVYTVQLRALSPIDGAVHATGSAQADGEDWLIRAFIDAGSALLDDLERQINVVGERREVPAMTPSLEAYRLFVEADLLYHERGESRRAADLLEEALAIDSAFALAWRLLMIQYSNILPSSTSSDSIRFAAAQARRFSDRLTAGQQHAAEADYERFVDTSRGLIDRQVSALRLYQSAVREDPGDPTVYRNLAGLLRGLGRYEEALEVYERADSLLPFGRAPLLQGNHALTLVELGRYDAARARIEELRTPRVLHEGGLQVILLGEEAWDEALELARTHLEDPTVEDFRLGRAAAVAVSALVARGRLREAQATVDGLATPELALRNIPDLGLLIALATKPVTDTGPLSFPDSLPGRFALPDNARADVRLMLENQQWRDVVRTIDDGVTPNRTLQYHDWLRGEAYVRLGLPDSAVVAFERVLDPTYRNWGAHYGHGVSFPYAHRRIALLYEQLDQPDRAEDHWAIFLNTVTDPDPEIQWMVDEAREHLEELARGR